MEMYRHVHSNFNNVSLKLSGKLHSTFDKVDKCKQRDLSMDGKFAPIKYFIEKKKINQPEFNQFSCAMFTIEISSSSFLLLGWEPLSSVRLRRPVIGREEDEEEEEDTIMLYSQIDTF